MSNKDIFTEGFYTCIFNAYSRIETVLKKLQARIPVVSEAEKDMHKELKKMEEKLKHYKNTIQQVG